MLWITKRRRLCGQSWSNSKTIPVNSAQRETCFQLP